MKHLHQDLLSVVNNRKKKANVMNTGCKDIVNAVAANVTMRLHQKLKVKKTRNLLKIY